MTAAQRTVLVCENTFDDGRVCGRWVVVSRGDLPTCPKCRRLERRWRVVSEAEIAQREREILVSLRISPDDHLGAKEKA